MREPVARMSGSLPPVVPSAPLPAGRCVLRAVEEDDIDVVVTYRMRSNVYQWLSHGGLASEQLREKFHRRIERMTEPSDERCEVQFVVERGGRVLGDCGFAITRAWTKDVAPTRHLVATADHSA